MDIKELARKYKDYVIDLRREFHMNPEPSWGEVRTSQRVREELDKMGIPYITAAGLGVVATIKGKEDGKTVALRADMDALELNEENDVPYKSTKPGLMHACGHDGHTAMLLGAARILNEIKDEIKGTVKLIFQPAEEIAQGAKKMMADVDFMSDVDGVFGIHLWSGLDIGKVSVEAGPRMAATDILKIKIKGKGGHGSIPHQTIDAVVAGSAVVMNLQTIVSREVSPHDSVVVTIGAFHAGSRFNIIAHEAILDGTTRYYNPDLAEELPKMIERIAKETARSFRADAELEYIYGTPAVINDAHCSKIAAGSVEKLLGKEGIMELEKSTGGEDISYFFEKAPGVMAFVGSRNPAKEAHYAHHHGRFNIDEDALEIGAALYAQYAVDFLNQ